jgi:hypothetical protein
MPIKFSTSTILNPSLVSDMVSRADTRMVKGQKTSSDSALAKMGRGYKNLSSKGITNNLNSNVSDNDFAAALLSTLGCSVSTESKEFTLLSQQTDTQEIQNENILDPSLFKGDMAGENIVATDKFSNDTSDPFFTLDESPETTLSQQAKQASTIKTIDLQDLTATIIDINLSNGGTTLKQFK